MLSSKLQELKLPQIAHQIDSFLERAAKENWPYDEFLSHLCDEELASKQEKRSEMNIRLAKFPTLKTLDGFDFSFQPSISQKQMAELSKGRWIANGENVILLGPPGVGKTHLSIALGIEAIKRGYKTLFISTQSILAALAKASLENKLEEKLKALSQPKLLIVDEIGYIPLDKQGANLFFQLIAKRYEKGAMVLTSNQAYTNWGQVFGDHVLATAILDRLLHHSTTINIKGDSYRLKEKMKAGLLNKNLKT